MSYLYKTQCANPAITERLLRRMLFNSVSGFRWIVSVSRKESTTYNDGAKAAAAVRKLWDDTPDINFTVFIEKFDGRHWKFAGKVQWRPSVS